MSRFFAAVIFGFFLFVSINAIAEETKRSFAELQTRAERGDAEAQFEMGNALYVLDHDGIKQDLEAAANWYRKAAEQGHFDAQFSLASMYSDGKGLPRDFTQAAKWYREAVKGPKKYSGCECGPQYKLDKLFEEGKSSPKDDVEAVDWYRRKTEKGDTEGLYKLAKAYIEGKGVEQSYTEAYFWSSLATYDSQDPKVVDLREKAGRHLTRAQIFSVQERMKEWDPLYKEYFAIDPETGEALNSTVRIIRDKENVNKPAKLFNEFHGGALLNNTPPLIDITSCKHLLEIGKGVIAGICTLKHVDGRPQVVNVCANTMTTGIPEAEAVSEDELKYVPSAIDSLLMFVVKNCFGG